MTIDDLAEEILNLSPKQREKLFESFGMAEIGSPPTFIVVIHDYEEDHIKRPLAAITPFGSPRNLPPEFRFIDIIASIEKDALSLGHPAILLAIRRWEQLVRYGKRNPLYQIALNHLRSVSKAILEGVKARMVDPNEIALVYEQHILGTDKNLLYVVWQYLGEKEIKNIKNSELRLSEIKNILINRIGESRQITKVNRICRFIKVRSWHTRRRPTWKTLQNDFYAWNAGLEVETTKVSRSRATGKFMVEGMELSFLPPDEFENERAFYNRKNAFFAGSLGNWANLPVVFLPEKET